MKAYVVLHGQTEKDTEGCLYGNIDAALTNTGREQAQEAGECLQSMGIDMILASPQTHTMETAEIIAGAMGFDKAKITKGVKFFERDLGDLEGKSIEEVDSFALSSLFHNMETPNGETVKQTANRVIPYANNMLKIFRTKTMLMVVPEHVFKILNWVFEGFPETGKERVIDTGNCMICEFETDDIPQDIKEFQPFAEKSESDGDSGSPDRLLSQSEIDDLIAQLSGGTL